jgi:predicted TIM-barrel fold metal-dependent hydrolase
LAAGYRDTTPLAQAWLQGAPERLVWGSDWPHVTESAHPPHTPALLDLLTDWAPSTAARHRVLVDNPAELYGF